MTIFHAAPRASILTGVTSGFVVNKTDNHTLLLSETNSHVFMSASTTKAFTLPVVTAADIGTVYTLYKFGVGGLMIFAQTGNTVTLAENQESAAGGGIMNTTTELFAKVKVKLMTATRWVSSEYTGTWDIAPSLLGGLVSYWNLEEASGTRFDSHTGGYNLTDVNTVAQIAGKIGFAAYFLKANQERLSIANAAFDFGTLNTSFTWACWANVDAVDANYNSTFMTFRQAGTNNTGHAMYSYSANGKATFTINDIQYVQSVAGISSGTWNLFVGYYDVSNDSIGVSLNGATYVTGAGANLGAVVGGTMALGSTMTVNGVHNLNGAVDEAAVWNRILTQTEVTNLYNSGAGLSYPFN